MAPMCERIWFAAEKPDGTRSIFGVSPDELLKAEALWAETAKCLGVTYFSFMTAYFRDESSGMKLLYFHKTIQYSAIAWRRFVWLKRKGGLQI